MTTKKAVNMMIKNSKDRLQTYAHTEFTRNSLTAAIASVAAEEMDNLTKTLQMEPRMELVADELFRIQTCIEAYEMLLCRFNKHHKLRNLLTDAKHLVSKVGRYIREQDESIPTLTWEEMINLD